MIKGPEGGQLTFLSENEVQRIHEAALKVLAETGISTDSELILDAFAGGSANVDRTERRIRIPRDLIDTALSQAPGSIVLHGRDPEKDILVEGRRLYFGLGGSPTPRYREPGTGRVREPTRKDVAQGAVVGDALENISFVMSLAGAYEATGDMHFLHEFEALVTHTTKPIVYCAPSRSSAAMLLEMAAAVAGGEAELRRRPPVTLFAESLSPLCLPSYCENMAEFAAIGAPILFSPSPMMGATSPVTLAGNLVIGHAETLAGLCFVQILNPGTPVIYGPHTPVMDMRTSRSTYAATEQTVARVGVVQLARFCGLPCFGTGGGTDSKCPDAQAGAEIAMNIFFNALAGLNLTQGVGTTGSGDYGCLENALIGNEIIGMALRAVAGVIVDEASLAVDLISEIGPQGDYLAEPHTAEFFRREMYMPGLFDRQSPRLWEEAGGIAADAAAADRVEQILAEHTPEPISEKVCQQLSDILGNA
ncbi:MAG: trimethylamine methyltransferase family protein [Lentisphaeria bacterium]|jgi:trimethylamine--corrinoid protein Co-methyltransferase|nr:trimethylamine methyltransferase family protein [Lentisphaeria bacterium]